MTVESATVIEIIGLAQTIVWRSGTKYYTYNILNSPNTNDFIKEQINKCDMVSVNLLVMGSLNNKCLVIFLVLLVFIEGFPGGSMVKNLPANTGDEGSNSGLGRFPWRRKWQPTSVFLPGKSRVQSSLVGYIQWGHKRVGHDLGTKHILIDLIAFFLVMFVNYILIENSYFPLDLKKKKKHWHGVT